MLFPFSRTKIFMTHVIMSCLVTLCTLTLLSLFTSNGDMIWILNNEIMKPWYDMTSVSCKLVSWSRYFGLLESKLKEKFKLIDVRYTYLWRIRRRPSLFTNRRRSDRWRNRRMLMMRHRIWSTPYRRLLWRLMNRMVILSGEDVTNHYCVCV